ncbi:MAG TPA: DMT family transporter [Chitinophagaceae bacterium]|nr:DMT family transporter [Chitinophagaceae bacterium]
MKKALIKVHIAVLLAGFTGPLGRLISLNEVILVWYRLLFTSLTLVIILLVRRELKILPGHDLKRFAFTGLLLAIHWTLFYGSIKYANVSVGLVCFSSTSLFTAILEPLILKRKFEPSEILLSLLVLAGIFIIFQFNAGYRLGILLGISAAIFAAIFTILNKKLVQIHQARTVSTYMLCFGLLWLTLVMPAYLHFFPETRLIPDGRDLIYLLLLSWFCTVLAFTLSINALKEVSPFTLNLSLTLEPVYGILLAFVLFRENRELNSWFYAGMGLILLSVILQMRRVLQKNIGLSP